MALAIISAIAIAQPAQKQSSEDAGAGAGPRGSGPYSATSHRVTLSSHFISLCHRLLLCEMEPVSVLSRGAAVQIVGNAGSMFRAGTGDRKCQRQGGGGGGGAAVISASQWPQVLALRGLIPGFMYRGGH